MIIGLGIDTVTISQVDGFLQNPNYALDIFTETEIQQASESRDAADFLSGRFAAKQALRKALEPLIHDTLDYLGVSIVKTDYSQPVAVFDGKLAQQVKEAGIREVKVSITTEGDAATSIVIAQD
ncbi:MAG: holo-ACP synthase [Erysipelotrichaceae bacterium]|nr:holo-ACP synthase [Erysipelotrichaceae bacterium]